MATLTFQDLKFEETKEKVRIIFLDNFYFEVDPLQLERIAPFHAQASTLVFKGISEKEARAKLNVLIDQGFEDLTSKVTGKRAIYVNKYFGLPLIGSTAFGIVDRNSNLIEVKPITGCNMNCTFCSVDEGLSSRKKIELVIDKDYLAEELGKLIAFKDCDVRLTINAHGEPTTYAPMPALIAELAANPRVKAISLITNGTLLTEQYIDELAKAKLSSLNVSLNAVSEKLAKMLEGHGKYDVQHVMAMCAYASKKMEVVLAPVFVPGYNDQELGEIIKFAKTIGAKVGIQNYLFYAKGRSPRNAAQMPWDSFYGLLKKLESEHDFKLMLEEGDFGIIKTKPLQKPFRKGQIVEAMIKCPGRYPNEVIAAAKERSITLTLPAQEATQLLNSQKGRVKIRITSDKHNIFYGSLLK